LVLCRLLTGFGVSALSTAATLTTADYSTPLNRATSMAPMMSSFAAGTALGPVIGGVLADRVGIHSTFYLVGCIYLTLTAINKMALTETKMQERVFPWTEAEIRNETQFQKEHDTQHGTQNGTQRQKYNLTQNAGRYNNDDNGVLGTVKDAISQWIPLLKIENVRNVVIMNGFYWAALSGSQMTLLPLILTNPEGLAFTATQVGKVYMGMSLVQVLGNPTMATAIDKIGKVTGIVCGCTFLSSSMFALAYCTEMNEVVATCGLWALGSTMLSTAPVSFISDNVSDRERAQAIALFRTVGDVGFLVGAMSTGAMADAFDMDIALHSSAGMLLTATGWFTTRSLIGRQKSI
jgi:MFS family permease